jgi:hypothetical protein
LSENPIAAAPPNELWKMCAKTYPDDLTARGLLYSHAMEEAGHLVPMAATDPLPGASTPCSRCGWQPPVVTVAIVSYKTPELAERCRESIGQPRWLDSVHVSETGEHNIGYAAALNVMLLHATTPILIACNADVEFPSQGVERLLSLFDSHPELGVLGPRQIDRRGYITHGGIDKEGDTSGGREFGQLDVAQLTEPFAEVEQVSGSVMFIRREAYEAVGGFANMPRLYYEDAILCHRMRRRGWQVAYSGSATFLHHVAASPSDERNALAAEGRRAWADELRSDINQPHRM